MSERSTALVDFYYSYTLGTYTFITPKPEYKPSTFVIFQTFSSSVWIIITMVAYDIKLMTMTLV